MKLWKCVCCFFPFQLVLFSLFASFLSRRFSDLFTRKLGKVIFRCGMVTNSLSTCLRDLLTRPQGERSSEGDQIHRYLQMRWTMFVEYELKMVEQASKLFWYFQFAYWRLVCSDVFFFAVDEIMFFRRLSRNGCTLKIIPGSRLQMWRTSTSFSSSTTDTQDSDYWLGECISCLGLADSCLWRWVALLLMRQRSNCPLHHDPSIISWCWRTAWPGCGWQRSMTRVFQTAASFPHSFKGNLDTRCLSEEFSHCVAVISRSVERWLACHYKLWCGSSMPLSLCCAIPCWGCGGGYVSMRMLNQMLIMCQTQKLQPCWTWKRQDLHSEGICNDYLLSLRFLSLESVCFHATLLGHFRLMQPFTGPRSLKALQCQHDSMHDHGKKFWKSRPCTTEWQLCGRRGVVI